MFTKLLFRESFLFATCLSNFPPTIIKEKQNIFYAKKKTLQSSGRYRSTEHWKMHVDKQYKFLKKILCV